MKDSQYLFEPFQTKIAMSPITLTAVIYSAAQTDQFLSRAFFANHADTAIQDLGFSSKEIIS